MEDCSLLVLIHHYIGGPREASHLLGTHGLRGAVHVKGKAETAGIAALWKIINIHPWVLFKGILGWHMKTSYWHVWRGADVKMRG